LKKAKNGKFEEKNAQLKRENRISFDIEKGNIKRMITLIHHN